MTVLDALWLLRADVDDDLLGDLLDEPDDDEADDWRGGCSECPEGECPYAGGDYLD